jgi:shikimate dehydrogenase
VTEVRTRHVVGLVGTGIEASLSPALHEREAELLGLRYVYLTLDLASMGLGGDDVGELLDDARRLGFSGLNVTHPCKQLVVKYLDELSPEAELLGAVNTVVFAEGRAVGHNTDWSGFGESFARSMPDARTEEVVLVGAGGAGAAVGYALLDRGCHRVTVVDLDDSRAAALAAGLQAHAGRDRARVGPFGELGGLLAAADGLVHATPVGMAALPGMAFDASFLSPHLWVAEVVYGPLETELLRESRAAGCRTLDGGGMAVFQAADSLRLFTGCEPDVDRMLQHFARLEQRHGER